QPCIQIPPIRPQIILRARKVSLFIIWASGRNQYNPRKGGERLGSDNALQWVLIDLSSGFGKMRNSNYSDIGTCQNDKIAQVSTHLIGTMRVARNCVHNRINDDDVSAA